MSVGVGVALDLETTERRPATAGFSTRNGRARLYLVSDAAHRPAVATRWRLTRRGRAVLLGLFVVLVAVLAVGWGAASASGASTEPRNVTVIVGDGDTLWSIAADVVPDGDRRATIERIKDANGLQGSAVEPGQRLVVPVDTP